MQMAMAGVDNLKPSAVFNDGKDADAVEDLANDDGDDDGGDMMMMMIVMVITSPCKWQETNIRL